jgi:universal stress protein A
MIMSTGYTHVLVAVDFAPDSTAVLDRAVEIAQHYQAALTLLHVVEYTESAYSGELVVPGDASMDKELIEHAEKRLAELKEQIRMPNAQTRVELGTPKHEIVRVAEENKVDLVVTGSHGRHGLQLLLGSTANGVLHLAKCDVLAVRVAAE